MSGATASKELVIPVVDRPDISGLVVEDDTPVDNLPSEKQQRLLTESLYASWGGPPSEGERERAESERERAESERERAESERKRADDAETRAHQLAARLRELGVDPDGGA